MNVRDIIIDADKSRITSEILFEEKLLKNS